jgi:hypothetical protein
MRFWRATISILSSSCFRCRGSRFVQSRRGSAGVICAGHLYGLLVAFLTLLLSRSHLAYPLCASFSMLCTRQ